MARGKDPKHQLTIGNTRREGIHFRRQSGELVAVDVIAAVNRETDPELADQLLNQNAEPLNAYEGEIISMPLLYHDPGKRDLVLVLPEGDRHRELEHRANLLRDLSRQPGSLPEYAVDFAVVYEGSGLSSYLKRRREIDDREKELVRRQEALDEREHALLRRSAAVEKRSVELSREAARLRKDESRNDLSRNESTTPAPRFSAEEISDGDSGRSSSENERTSGAEVHVSVSKVAPLIAEDAAEDGGQTSRRRRPDGALRKWLKSDDDTLAAIDPAGMPRFVVAIDDALQQTLMAARLDVKLQLHRLRSSAIPSLSVSCEGDMDSRNPSASIWSFDFDLDAGDHREVLSALGRDFRFALDLYSNDKEPIGRRLVSADLAENARVVVAAGDECRSTMESSKRAFADACREMSNPSFDRFALEHPHQDEFSDDTLRCLGQPADVFAALMMVRKFTNPDYEDYLILTRGYSLSQWQQRIRSVLARAVELGLWVGHPLATIAVREGMARGKEELVGRLLGNFGELIADGGHRLTDQQVADNWRVLREQGASLAGPRVPPRTDPIHSEEAPAVSGIIGGAAGHKHVPTPGQTVHPLVKRLENKDHRLSAALDLISMGSVEWLPQIFQAIEGMTRAEAGRVLGVAVRLGDSAVPHLIGALQSRKAFIRQGCALAIGTIGGDVTIESLCDLLFKEPTEIWREVARAIGLVGAPAVARLVEHARANDERSERAEWALAHIAAGGGGRVVESLAKGRDAYAAKIASAAQDAEAAARDDIAVLRAGETREVTVNRAFSRRFFQALEERSADDTSPAPMELLDEADLVDITDLEDDTPHTGQEQGRP